MRRYQIEDRDDAYQNPYYFTARTLCDVLSEMRKCHETHNYSYLPGLIEEAQSLGNRMEAGLEQQKDLKQMAEQWSIKKAELKKLHKELLDTKEALDKTKCKKCSKKDETK